MRGVLPMHSVRAEPTTAIRILNAQQFATEICGGHLSAKYVTKHFRHLGSKPGKEWLWREDDARFAWAEAMPRKTG